MQNSPNRFPELRDSGFGMTIRTVERDKLLCLENVAFVNPFLVHDFSNVSENFMIRNGKITVAMLSYCLTTTLKGMDVSILPIIRVTTVFLYILLIVENNRGGSAYLDGIVIRSF